MTLNRFFSASGRLPRGRFWLQAMAVWVALYVVSGLLGERAVGAVVWLVNGLALLALVLLCIRRLHDRNRSGWWLLAVLVPVAGALWLAWQLGLRRGVDDDNRWGADPLRPDGDYLVVG